MLIIKKILVLLVFSVLLLGSFQSAQAVTKGIGQTADVTVNCSDADANLVQCNVTSPCSLTTCSVSGSSGSCSCRYTCVSAGTYNACGQARDSQGGIDDDCLDTVVCNGLPDKPGVPLGYPAGESWDHCVFQELSLPTFHWTYSDPEGNPQVAYEIRIDNDSDFTVVDGDEYRCGGQTCSGGSSIAYTPVSADWSDWMAWNRANWWIVRVQDNYSNWSPWSDANQFVTPLHPYPSPDFTHEPSIPTAEEEVLFVDSSVCYSAGPTPYLCKNNLATRYQWDFEDDLSIDCDSNINSQCRGNATTTYIESGNYLVRLNVTDDLGACDTTGDTPISTSLPLPEYKEVPPIIWLKKLFASFIELFDGFFTIPNGS